MLGKQASAERGHVSRPAAAQPLPPRICGCSQGMGAGHPRMHPASAAALVPAAMRMLSMAPANQSCQIIKPTHLELPHRPPTSAPSRASRLPRQPTPFNQTGHRTLSSPIVSSSGTPAGTGPRSVNTSMQSSCRRFSEPSQQRRALAGEKSAWLDGGAAHSWVVTCVAPGHTTYTARRRQLEWNGTSAERQSATAPQPAPSSHLQLAVLEHGTPLGGNHHPAAPPSKRLACSGMCGVEATVGRLSSRPLHCPSRYC